MSCLPTYISPAAADIIGDVHGHADELHELLHELGYRRTSRTLLHPERRLAIFVGDLIDGGPDPRGILETVAAMQDAGSAKCVMGNMNPMPCFITCPGGMVARCGR